MALPEGNQPRYRDTMSPRAELFIWITIAQVFLTFLAILILPRVRRSMVSMILVLGNIVIFATHVIFDASLLSGNISFMGASSGSYIHLEIWNGLGFQLSDLLHGREPYTLITSLFVHGDVMHLIMNMIVLLFLGMPFERRIGPRNFAIVFFTAGVGAALLEVLLFLTFGDALGINRYANGIGASGAIFGVLGAYVSLFPRDKVLFPLILIRRWPVFVIALLYGALETLSVLRGIEDGVGHIVHLNGLLVGLAVALVMKRMGLFEKKKKKAILTLDILREMAVSEDERKTLERIEEEDITEVKDAWIEHLLETAKCPRCGGAVDLAGSRSCTCGHVVLGHSREVRK